MKPKAILFDFDGVIVDTEKIKFANMQQILKQYGVELKPEQKYLFIGRKRKTFLKEQYPNINSQKVLEEARSCDTPAPLIPGVKNLLSTLAKTHKLILVTGSQRGFVEPILVENNIAQYFTSLTTGEDFESSKPNPECYLMTLQKTGIKANEAIIIEDAPSGITAGKVAKCTVYAIETSVSKQYLASADKIFSDHQELLDYFSKASI